MTSFKRNCKERKKNLQKRRLSIFSQRNERGDGRIIKFLSSSGSHATVSATSGGRAAPGSRARTAVSQGPGRKPRQRGFSYAGSQSQLQEMLNARCPPPPGGKKMPCRGKRSRGGTGPLIQAGARQGTRQERAAAQRPLSWPRCRSRCRSRCGEQGWARSRCSPRVALPAIQVPENGP